tara:strand:+ start:20860 stop:21840 length:981 start_codon:yes stop_codon:yes gene_type:complete
MPTIRKPRAGSLQFWPRKRAKRQYARVRSYKKSKEPKLLGFPGYKVGMTHILHIDNRKTSLTKGTEISCPVTIIECPNIKIASIRFYKNSLSAYGYKLLGEVFAEKLDKELGRKIVLGKSKKTIEDFKNFDEIRVNVYTQPKLTGIGKKKPELFELRIGGSKKEQLNYAKENLGKEIKVADIFKPGQQVDSHSVTKGKGYQGVVKRFGVGLRSHKSEKTIRGAVTAPEGLARIKFTAPMAGRMGFHLRTEFNKWLMKISDKAEEINPKGGFIHYGLVKTNFILLRGSLPGPKKRMIILTDPMRANKLIPNSAPDITHISLESQQGR